jgi:hypothetical protein
MKQLKLKHPGLYKALASLPKTILTASGRFLYSDISALKPGKFYLLGFNPGAAGDSDEYRKSLEDEISEWCNKQTNAYLDEIWPPHLEGGGHPVQTSVKALWDAVGVNARDVCASNLLFVRSKGEDDLAFILGADPKKCAEDVFWPVHKAVLDIVKPSCIVAFGIGTYNMLKGIIEHKHSCRFKEKGPFRTGHLDRGRECRWHVANGQCLGRPLKLVGIHHFTYFPLSRYPDVLRQIAEECSSRG